MSKIKILSIVLKKTRDMHPLIEKNYQSIRHTKSTYPKVAMSYQSCQINKKLLKFINN
jgi:hypothetical protein